jgi:hypothetical protein
VTDDLHRRYAAARAEAESKHLNAQQARQVFDGLVSQALEGVDVGDDEISAAAKHASQTDAEARVAEQQAEALRPTLPDVGPVSAKPRPKVRFVSAISAAAWKERVLAMSPETAAAKGLSPWHPPLIEEA